MHALMQTYELVACTYTHEATNVEGLASARHLHVLVAFPFFGFTNVIHLIYK